MINNYYIKQDDEQVGPYTQFELMEMDLDVHTKVLSPLSNRWEEISDLPEFFEYFESKGHYFPTENNLAGFWWRVLAYFIDYIILIILIIMLGSVLGVIMGLAGFAYMINSLSDESSASQLILNLVGIVANIVYHSIFEATPMRGSIGKVILKLAVVDADGQRESFGKALSRNAGKILSSLVLGIGFLCVLWDDHKQAWHDQLARTYVIRRA